VADVALDLGVSAQAIHGWRRQERIGRGLERGTSALERADLAAPASSWPRSARSTIRSSNPGESGKRCAAAVIGAAAR